MRDVTLGATRSADEIGLHLRRYLPGTWQGRQACAAFLQNRNISLHLAEISQAVAPRAHAVVVMDQAGWHTTDKLADQLWNIMTIAGWYKVPSQLDDDKRAQWRPPYRSGDSKSRAFRDIGVAATGQLSYQS